MTSRYQKVIKQKNFPFYYQVTVKRSKFQVYHICILLLLKIIGNQFVQMVINLQFPLSFK